MGGHALGHIPELAAPRQGDVRQDPPALIIRRGAGDLTLFHLRNELLDVIRHQIQLVQIVLLRRVHRHLGGRQPEDQPAAAHVHVLELEHVAQQRAIGLGILAIDDCVSAGDLHAVPPKSVPED